ncbi:hypothetical protein [Streptomyces pseudogriseolus]|uniref:hypothetical protein n=1 Tax=Streptomyces pseudogriseolus TaxID=36817 RepID=UPI003FA2FEC5
MSRFTCDGTEVPLTGSYLEVEENRLLVVGMDVPGRAEPSVQGSTMLLDSLTRFLAEGPTA